MAWSPDLKIPDLDEHLKAYVKRKEKDPEHTLNDVMENAVKDLEALCAISPVALHGGGLASPAFMSSLISEPKATNMARIVAGTILHYALCKGGNISRKDIESFYSHGKVYKEDLNFSFPPVGMAEDGKMQVTQKEDGHWWPEPYCSEQGVRYKATWIAGDKTFAVLDRSSGQLSAEATEKMREFWWVCPMCARIPNIFKDEVKELPSKDLPGVFFSFEAHPPQASEVEHLGYFFCPREGWAGKRLGTPGRMDMAGNVNEQFEQMNSDYEAFKVKYPTLCGYFDNRKARTVWAGKTHTVKVHSNMEMMTVSPKPKTKDVILNPASGLQCHATLCGPDGEIAKFCLSDKGFTYPIPFNPFAKDKTKAAFYWSDMFMTETHLRTMFYAFAHVGEQTTNSLAHEHLLPKEYASYQMFNKSQVLLVAEHDVRKSLLLELESSQNEEIGSLKRRMEEVEDKTDRVLRIMGRHFVDLADAVGMITDKKLKV